MNRFLFRFLRASGIGLLVIVIIGAIVFFIVDKPLPEGRGGTEAERLSEKMLTAVNIQAWDTLHYLSWSSMRSGCRYVWDRKLDWVYAKLPGQESFIDTKSGKGIVRDETGRDMVGDRLTKALAAATHGFWNDSFWLLAFTKVNDDGCSRKVVDLEDGEKGLLVTYSTGGTTPGDSYLWELEQSGRPKAWRIWTQALPVGGIRFTWENWKSLPGGAMYARDHKIFSFSIKQDLVSGGQRLEEIGMQPDLFAPLARHLKNNP